MIRGFTLERAAACVPSWLAHRATSRVTDHLLLIAAYSSERRS